jgi:hypothetical protein
MVYDTPAPTGELAASVLNLHERQTILHDAELSAGVEV